jgi:hypothetical protein
MAPNLQAVLDWVKANRPDCLAQFESICTNDPGGHGHAFLFLITIGFQAGRQYQIDHPELDSYSYHTDDPRLPRHPPRTSAEVAKDRAGG